MAFKALMNLPDKGLPKDYKNLFNLKVIMVFDDRISIFDDY